MEYEIRKLAVGEKIEEPGFYEIPIEQHHNQPCVGKSVTSGVLRMMEKGTPADVWAYSKWNPDCWVMPETAALNMGKAMASYIEAGNFGLNEHVLVLPQDKPRRPTPAQLEAYEETKGIIRAHSFIYPTGSPRRPTDKQLAAIAEGKGTEAALKSYEFWKPVVEGGKKAVSEAEMTAIEERRVAVDFWREVDEDPRTVIDNTQYQLIVDMGSALTSDPAAMAALGAAPELTMAWIDEKTGLWCLARPDQTGFSGMLSDFKKMHCPGYFSNWHVDKMIEIHGYDMQMAFADEGFEQLTGNPAEAIGLVCQSDKPPYSVILRPIGKEDIMLARFLNRRSLDRIAECLETGRWPGPGETIGEFQRNEKRRESLIAEMELYGQ